MTFEGTKLLGRQFFRQAIWETFNSHQSGGGSDIALIGSRRSGSTLLMQVIAHHKGMKSVDQPFSIYTSTSAQMQHLPWPAGGIFVRPTPQEADEIKTYLEGLKSGDIHVQEPWRIWSKDFHFRSNRLVLKTTDAHHILPNLVQAGFLPILYFRHPVPQSVSCARNNWGDKLATFSRSRIFVEEVLSADQRSLLENLIDGGEELDRYILGWCLENMPLFDALQSGMPAIYYEDMVLHPDETLDRLVALCNLEKSPAMRAMFGNASVSVKGLSDPEGAAAIKAGDAQALIGRWRSKIDETTLSRLQAILDHFPGCPYSTRELVSMVKAA